jgi:hypothetical protein
MKDELSLLARTPETLRALVSPLSSEIVAFREAPATWTITEVVCHMTDGEVSDWVPRVRRILSEPHVPFEPFDRERGFARYRGRSAAWLLDEFADLRRRNLDEVRNLVPDASALGRTGTHPDLGTVTLGQLIATWAAHDASHLSQISRVLVRYFGQHVGPWKAYFSLLRPPV